MHLFRFRLAQYWFHVTLNGAVRLFQLSLVDLAGSERVGKTGATAQQLKVRCAQKRWEGGESRGKGVNHAGRGRITREGGESRGKGANHAGRGRITWEGGESRGKGANHAGMGRITREEVQSPTRAGCCYLRM